MFPVTVNIYDRLGIGTFFRITDIGSLVSGFLAAVLIFSSLAFIIYFVWGALSWLTAGGDKAQVEAARQRISNALIGLTLVAAAWAVYLLVIYVLGLGGVIGTAGGGSGGSGGIAGGGGSAPSGYCVCGGAGGCVAAGTKGPISLSNPQCYQCQSNGSWPAVPGDLTCVTAISCSTCP
jgi:hypothetical protein